MTPRRLGPSFYDRIGDACRDAGFSPRVAQEAVQMQTIAGLVAAGIGVALVPELALVPESERNLNRKGVVFKPIRGKRPEVGMALVWRPEDPSTVLRAFLDAIE